MKHTIIATGLSVFAGAAMAQTPVLTVYTYDSFVPEWGAGPAIEAAFEAECACDLQWVGTGDGASMLARLLLEGDRTEADVILGLDTNLTAAARGSGLIMEHGITPEGLTVPVAWDDRHFLPFDWSYFAFVHRRGLENVPGSFEELAESDISILLQDPRSSTPGLGTVMWIQTAYGDRAGEIWEGLADNIVTITPSWSDSYALFLDGEADMVMSWTTSPAYHLIAENDPGFTTAEFSEGHYLQVEVAGIVASTDVPELARAFMEFMISPGFQDVIPTTNWMYPAASDSLPEGFAGLTVPEQALLLSPEEAAAIRDEALATWQRALSR
jgi:thiamine transport system substrate-binding protein